MGQSDWADLGAVEELRDPPVRTVKVGRLQLAVSYLDGRFGMISNAYNHVGGPLGEGRLDEEHVVCPWHAYKFHFYRRRRARLRGGLGPGIRNPDRKGGGFWSTSPQRRSATSWRTSPIRWRARFAARRDPSGSWPSLPTHAAGQPKTWSATWPTSRRAPSCIRGRRPWWIGRQRWPRHCCTRMSAWRKWSAPGGKPSAALATNPPKNPESCRPTTPPDERPGGGFRSCEGLFAFPPI
jgi:Rieske 2Fe-2S protein